MFFCTKSIYYSALLSGVSLYRRWETPLNCSSAPHPFCVHNLHLHLRGPLSFWVLPKLSTNHGIWIPYSITKAVSLPYSRFIYPPFFCSTFLFLLPFSVHFFFAPSFLLNFHNHLNCCLLMQIPFAFPVPFFFTYPVSHKVSYLYKY